MRGFAWTARQGERKPPTQFWFAHSRSTYAEARRGADSCAREGNPLANTSSAPTNEAPQWPTLASLRLQSLAAGLGGRPALPRLTGEASFGASPLPKWHGGSAVGAHDDDRATLSNPEGLS